MEDQHNIGQLTAHLFRECSGKMAAVLSCTFGLQHLDVVMDAVQDSFEAALTKWRFSGIPQNPEGWLMLVAKNKAINMLKRDNKTIPGERSVFLREAADDTDDSSHLLMDHEVDDAQLRLLLMCCHPDFPDRTQVMLTLHVLCGFGVAEIANALFMTEEAVKKALTRTKAELKQKSNLIYTPSLLQFEKRIDLVHTILYLIFNEGYKTTKAKEVINNDLCYEAIRLAKLLLKNGVALTSETNALISLMFFNLSRFPSRLSDNNELLTLEEQDRTLWNKVFIEEGYHYLAQATKSDKLSRYHIEAIISSIHCAASSFGTTDWQTIIRLYELLEQVAPSPMVSFNKVLAQSYLQPSKEVLDAIAAFRAHPFFKDNYLLHAAEGDLWKRMGDWVEAKKAFQQALERVSSQRERALFQRKINECNS